MMLSRTEGDTLEIWMLYGARRLMWAMFITGIIKQSHGRVHVTYL
jgi:hypothetical protein